MQVSEFDIGNAPPPVSATTTTGVTNLATSAITTSSTMTSTVTALVSATSTTTKSTAPHALPPLSLQPQMYKLTQYLWLGTPIVVSSFNTKPICSATNDTTVRPLNDHYSIEVTVPEYKSTA